MKIYNYHPDYKTYVGSSLADESPLEPGVFLIPAHATELEPPSCENCEISIFTENNWEIISNCMGIYYNKETKEPFEWYNPINSPQNGTKNPPPQVENEFLIKWGDTDWVIIESKVGIYYEVSTGKEIINEDPNNEPENATKQQPPEVPEGYWLTWNDGWELIEAPKPPIPTPQQKLEQAGFTVEELKELLGLT